MAGNILECREDVEECVNDTWLHAWNAMPPHCPQALGPFFGKLTRNLSFTRWREYIARTELMYRAERTAEHFMPYYRFLVEVDGPAVVSEDTAALGLKTCGAYYVPAVRGKYLTGMPVWNGDFNI